MISKVGSCYHPSESDREDHIDRIKVIALELNLVGLSHGFQSCGEDAIGSRERLLSLYLPIFHQCLPWAELTRSP